MTGVDAVVGMRRLVEAAGLALYGSRWQTDLAVALDVNSRTMRRWVAGERAIPPAKAIEILDLLEARRATIGMVAEGIRAQAAVRGDGGRPTPPG